MTGDVPSYFLLLYRCPECSHEFPNIWTGAVDDTCPECGCENISPHFIEPHTTVDLTDLSEEELVAQIDELLGQLEEIVAPLGEG